MAKTQFEQKQNGKTQVLTGADAAKARAELDEMSATANRMSATAGAMSQQLQQEYIVEEPPEVVNEEVPLPGGDGGTPQDSDSQFGYKVRLFAARGFPRGDYVLFEATPSFSENRSVEYTPVAPVHLPGSIQVYKRTGARTFSVGAKLISRNVAQATRNMTYLQLLRGWTMPYFGARDYTTTTGSNGSLASVSEDANSMLGAPPDVLYLYAYSSRHGSDGDRDFNGGLVNIKKVPVVITSLGITYPEDVDYIPVSHTGEPFPVKMDVTIELTETHSPVGYENFSLKLFKTGQLVQF